MVVVFCLFHTELYGPIRYDLFNSLQLATKCTQKSNEGVWKKRFDWLSIFAFSPDVLDNSGKNPKKLTSTRQGLVLNDSKHAKL